MKLSTAFSVALAGVAASAAFVHPGALHTSKDMKRVKQYVQNQTEPMYTDWKLLLSNSHCTPTYTPNPQATIYRGSGSENYPILYHDAAAAYQLAVAYHVNNDTAYADASIKILNAWANKLVKVTGGSNAALAYGIYGYQLANAAELMRVYEGWSDDEQQTFKNFFGDVFTYGNRRFLETHYGQVGSHYWSNWDFCNMASMMAGAILRDSESEYQYVRNYFWNGVGEGRIGHFIVHNFTEEGTGKRLAETEEMGRDQGHATLDFTLLGVILQQAYNQGDDLFGALNNSALAGSEYCSKYNLGYDVPFESYYADGATRTGLGSSSRGTVRPGFELLYAHYNDVKGLNASWTGAYRDYINSKSTDGVEGGGGNYGGNSGGFDGLGYGTLLYRRSA